MITALATLFLNRNVCYPNVLHICNVCRDVSLLGAKIQKLECLVQQVTFCKRFRDMGKV